MNKRILEKHLRNLSCVYTLHVDEEFEFIIVREFPLPPGYNEKTISIWMGIPSDYPETPPGIATNVHLPVGLRFEGRKPRDYHENNKSGWAWWCYQYVTWDPCRDDLIVFLEIVRAHMTNPG